MNDAFTDWAIAMDPDITRRELPIHWLKAHAAQVANPENPVNTMISIDADFVLNARAALRHMWKSYKRPLPGTLYINTEDRDALKDALSPFMTDETADIATTMPNGTFTVEVSNDLPKGQAVLSIPWKE